MALRWREHSNPARGLLEELRHDVGRIGMDRVLLGGPTVETGCRPEPHHGADIDGLRSVAWA